MAYIPMCKASGGTSAPDADGDTHVHVCGEDSGHDRRQNGQAPTPHACHYCPHTW